MNPKALVSKLAKEHGASIENASAGDTWHFNIDAPKGYIWKDAGVHCIVASTHKGDKTWLDEMWQDALERMQEGIETCPDRPNCEICDEEEE